MATVECTPAAPAALPRTPSPLSPSMCADTSFSGRTPGLRRIRSSSASRRKRTRSAGSRYRGFTQPARSY